MQKAAKALLYLGAVMALAFGLRYIPATSVMPYHVAFLGVPNAEAPLTGLLLLLYKVIGFGFVAFGVTTAILAAPAAGGSSRARWALLAAGVLNLARRRSSFFRGYRNR